MSSMKRKIKKRQEAWEKKIKDGIDAAWEQAVKEEAEGKPMSEEEKKQLADMKAALKESELTGKPVTLDFNGMPVSFMGGVDYNEWLKEQEKKNGGPLDIKETDVCEGGNIEEAEKEVGEETDLPTAEDMSRALEQSKEDGKPVTLDFGGIPVSFEGDVDYDDWIKMQKGEE